MLPCGTLGEVFDNRLARPDPKTIRVVGPLKLLGKFAADIASDQWNLSWQRWCQNQEGSEQLNIRKDHKYANDEISSLGGASQGSRYTTRLLLQWAFVCSLLMELLCLRDDTTCQD